MKRLLLILILTFSFQSWTKADDIRDFQIEGMSIGDSLLDFFNEEEIIKNIDKNMFKELDGKFKTSGFYRSFGNYEGMQFSFKINDRKYIIYGFTAGIFYSDFQKCKKKMKSISKDLSSLFSNAEISIGNKSIMAVDKTGKSHEIADYFDLKNGYFKLSCVDWSDEITSQYEWSDNLRLEVVSKEYSDWLPKQ